MTLKGIVFILSLLMTAFVTFNSLRKVMSFKKDFFDKHDNLLDKISIGITALTFIAGIADVAGNGFLGLNGYYITDTIYMAGSLFIVSCMENLHHKNKNTGFIVFILKAFTVVMLAEIFVFNFDSYHIIFGNYPEKVFFTDESKISHEVTSTNDTIYSFENIDVPVGTITIDADIVGTTADFMFKIGVSDETTSTLRTDAARIWVVPEYPETYSSPVNFSGKVNELTVKTYLPDEQSAYVNAIIVNRPVALKFSFLRFSFFMLVSVFVYLLAKGKSLNMPVADDKRFFRMSVNIITIVVMCTVTVLAVTTRYFDDGLYNLFHLESGDQMTQDLVDAFESGHTYMTFEPTQKILDMENPYDSVTRDKLGYVMNVDYAWDHLLYNGKYYSYYGIAPVILLFLPYHLLTGYYFPAAVAVFIFSMIGVFALSRIYIAFIERWFDDLPQGMAILGMMVMMASCGIYFSTARPEFYETAISAGFMFICSGMYFLITSNILSKGDISLKRLALSSVLLSLGVLSRPTTAVYCICAVIFMICGCKKAEKQFGKKMKYILSSLVPFVVIGSVQMIYNYVRFGSPLDFGIQYSLTVNDFTKSQYHTQFVFVTIYNFIFNMPSFVPDFPFISSSFQDLGTKGFYYKDAVYVNGIATGLIYRAMPVIAYIFSRKAYKLSENPEKKRYAFSIFVFSIIAPLAILFSIWESGYSVRYTADFSWQVLIGALAIFYILFMKCKNDGVRKIMKNGFIISVFLSIFVDFGQVYEFILNRGLSENYRGIYSMLARTFELWK